MSNTVLEVTRQVNELVVNPGAQQTVLEVQQQTVQLLTIGIQGPPGPSGAGVLVFDEVPAGAINGSNATFTTAFIFVPESVQVFINGLAQIKTQGFNTSGTQTIMLSVSPLAGEKVSVNYLRG